MKKNLLISFSFLLFGLVCTAQKTPKRELRGAWITTHFGLDWPTSSQTPAQQRSALISILDQHKATGMNAIYFQVRNQCDALYPSAIEPWSSTLTGVQGRDPGWDPLQFAIDETHKRGMELHAWLNPYRAVATASQLANFVPGHVAKQHPEWLLNNGSVITLNPGIPAVRDYIMSVIKDITSRYDIDGIHFDDYFYPAAPFNDDATYTADPRGFPATTAGRADWRRDNINIMIKRIYDELFVLKQWVKFGVSPSGIYRSSTDPAIGSNTSTGALQHYSAVYADTKKWIQQAWVDYIAPQVYWYIGQPGSDYKILIPWWNNIVANGRHIYIGQAIYKVNDATQGAPWTSTNPSQIPQQMRMNREAGYQNILGEIAFRTAFLRSNPLKVRDSIQLNIYKKPALLPAMPWRDNTPPPPPSALTAAKQLNNSYILNWTKPAATTNEMDKVRQFVIYRSQSSAIDINDTANILTITPTDVTTYTDNNTQANTTYYYTVTSVDRLYNESAPSNVTDYLPPTITCPGNQTLTLSSTCSIALPDYTTQATVSDDVSTPENIAVTQSPLPGTVINGTGNTTITLTATDGSGKKSTCTFVVKAEDKEAPVLTVPAAITVATDKDQCTAIVNYETSATDNCSPVNIVSDYPTGTAFAKGTTTVSVTATDASGNKTAKTFTVTVNDEQLPVIACPDNKTVNTNPGVCHAVVSLVNPVATDNCGSVTVAGKRSDDAALTAVYPKGNTAITWTATDASGNKVSCTQTITVEDKEKPLITNAYANPSVLWPPNHKMKTVQVFYKVSDNCGPVATALSITSNEDGLMNPKNGEPDYQVLDNHTVKLRAERLGSGNGRIYTITITATDASGNVSTETVTVLVPHDHSDMVQSSAPLTLKQQVRVLKPIQVTALPNPSSNHFTLITNGGSDAPLLLRIKDNIGRLIESRKNVSPNGTYLFGQRYSPGIYYVEVIQGDSRVVMKLIKQ
ncbi:MAG: family 10 glycosylhydrolase [Bacteroidota bacterium]|nr:family 10 glycosylhydrolase [Bacteroidota bacterium]